MTLQPQALAVALTLLWPRAVEPYRKTCGGGLHRRIRVHLTGSLGRIESTTVHRNATAATRIEPGELGFSILRSRGRSLYLGDGEDFRRLVVSSSNVTLE